MDPIMVVVIPGLVGGLVMALLALKFKSRRERRTSSDPFARDPQTDVINIAHIRVAGVGGLGLVAMAAVVALFFPRVGLPLALGLVLGVVLAAGLIFWRRRQGPMPSSGRGVGANTTLAIDARPPATVEHDRHSSNVHTKPEPALAHRG